jgi:kynurenine formamidase
LKILDLTHLIEEEMSVYPGTPRPSLLPVHSIDKDFFAETQLVLYSHHGTHIDAPKHVFDDGFGLEQLSMTAFVGSATVLRINSSDELKRMTIEELLTQVPDLPNADFLLISAGGEALWGLPDYDDFSPEIPEDIVHWLVIHHKKGIGIDAHSIDVIGQLRNHRIALAGSMIILENLTHLSELPNGLFQLFALPLHFKNADGAPARIIATWEELG